MLIGKSHSPLKARCLSFLVWRCSVHHSKKLARFKIAAGTLMTFTGEFFTEQIERRSCYNVVQIEVSFVSTRSVTTINNKYLASLWSGYCMWILHDHNPIQMIRTETNLNLFFPYLNSRGLSFWGLRSMVWVFVTPWSQDNLYWYILFPTIDIFEGTK